MRRVLTGFALASMLATTVFAVTAATAQAAPPPDGPSLVLGEGWADEGQTGAPLGDGTNSPTTPTIAALPAGLVITAVAAGYVNSAYLTSTGEVYTSGDYTYGEAGDGTTETGGLPNLRPVKAHFPAGTVITAVSVGYYDALALTSTGQVYAWGYNGVGQLGIGTTSSVSTPTLVHLPDRATAISAGYAHSLALTSDGTIYSWGLNNVGQLGDNSTTNSLSPVAVALPQGTTATAVAAGYAHSLAVTSAGGVLAWGYDNAGQLGIGSLVNKLTPVAVALPDGAKATAVSAGVAFSVALTTTGGVDTWGDNTYNELGDGTTTARATPVAVTLPGGVTADAISAGYGHTLVRTTAGAVVAWGYNNHGQVGVGTTTNVPIPTAVTLFAGEIVSSLGTSAYSYTSLFVISRIITTTTVTSSVNPAAAGQAVTFTATVRPAYRQVVEFYADGSTTPIAGCKQAVAMSHYGSYRATCRVTSLGVGVHTITATVPDSDLYHTSTGTLDGGQAIAASHDVALGWGNNSSGQLGTGGTSLLTAAQEQLPTGVAISNASAGYNHALLLTSTGGVYAIGDNTHGQLGDGTSTSSDTVVPVSFPDGVVISAVSAGYDDSFALTSTGTLYAWGLNSAGELGIATVADAHIPTLLRYGPYDGSVFTAVSAGYAHTLALTSTGMVYGWGYNAYGQVGDGTQSEHTSPAEVLVRDDSPAIAIAAGYLHSAAVTSDGSVLTWGDNSAGELGNGTMTSTLAPVTAPLPSGVHASAVSAGFDTTTALTTDGAVYDWGLNNIGQLGNGSTVNSTTAVAVSLPDTATAIASSYGDGYALSSTGAVYAWGDNSLGQLGNGSKSLSIVPVAVTLPGAATTIGSSSLSTSALAVVSGASTTTTTTLISSANPSVTGNQVTFTATVSPTAGGGTVAFFADGSTTPIDGCAASPLAGQAPSPRQASCTTGDLTAGMHVVVAEYSGAGQFGPSEGALPGGQLVQAETALYAADVKVVGSLLSMKVTYSAVLTVRATGAPLAGRTISFGSGGVQRCSAVTAGTGTATCTVSVALALRNYTATFAGEGDYLPSSATGAVSLF